MTATAIDLKLTIEAAWDNRDAIDVNDRSLNEAVEAAILRLDSGEERVAEKIDGEWRVNQWLKKAVLLSFRLNPMEAIPGGPGGAPWWDKVPSKFLGWGPESFAKAAFRAIVDPYRGHPQLFCGSEVLGHVLDHCGVRGIDAETAEHQFIAMPIRLWP